MSILVLGHPRGGTGFMSSLLTGCGLDIGHETMGADGISDWRRAPFPNSEFKHVIHVIRHPLKTIESMWLTTSIESRDYMWEHIMSKYGFYPMRDCLCRTCISYLMWHKMIKEHHLAHTVCVEDATIETPKWLWQNDYTEDIEVGFFGTLDRNAREHGSIPDSDWENVPRSILEEVWVFGREHGYK